MIKTYSELIEFASFKKRYEYLMLGGKVGEETFGFERYLNQSFYKSKEWRQIRDYVITRDAGCDLGIPGMEIGGRILIHHMNPIDIVDIREATDYLLDPEYLICVSHNTHNAIHYGDSSLLLGGPVIRTKNDQTPWRI